ncbi:hypothetical protein C8R45DRAFT_1085382 [Mycena sanguinolenta]|nr:hypothetical protein C8R45DRAFT_1085382 [Mycena sanguinolenta]
MALQKLREEPIELRKFLGHYNWVFDAAEHEREITLNSPFSGSLTLVADKKAIKNKSQQANQNQDIDPTLVKGSFDYFFEFSDVSSLFVGLTEHGECSWTFDTADLVETPEEEREIGGEYDFHGSKFFIRVVDVVDDNGNPLLMFTHSPGYRERDVTYIGKKQKSKSVREGLTDGERQRLGRRRKSSAALEAKKPSASAEFKAGNDAEPDDRDVDREAKGKDAKAEAEAEAEAEVNPRKRKAHGMPNEKESPCKK